MSNREGQVTIEDATILYRNFKGNPTTFNPRGGVSTFNVVLPEELVPAMLADGWNVKRRKPLDPEDDPESGDPHVEVTVRFDNYPPTIIMIGGTSGKRNLIDDELLPTLDDVEIANVDLKLNPSTWEDDNGNKRIKAYLDKMYITIVEDRLDLKYAVE